ncbi:MAG: hypothetical protein JW843_08550 [Candidatus Aminicenantes bacterium]|nr:hypothetical protein [Candidatus Aminicenantes bacterium]
MFDLRRWTFCKALAVILCAFIVMEAHALYAHQAAAVAEQHQAQFNAAREAYFAGNFEGARAGLDRLIVELEKIEGQDTFKGETYLLAGAAYEKLEQLGLSVKYYCRAKSLLGEGKTIEGLDLKKLKYYKADCAAIAAILEMGVGAETDELVAQYNQAKIGYFAGAYEAAKAVVESLVTSLGAIDGRDTFKGQVYLLAGAIYEILDFKELAIKYYCRAKAVLGEGTTIEGLKLDKLRWYKEPCGGAAVAGAAVRTAGRKKSWVGGLIGTLLGLALVGGIVWYLFFSKNAPLGKKGKYTKITFRIDVTYRGFNSTGHRTFKIGGEVKNDEDFIYTQNISSDEACSQATKSETYSYTYTITGDSVAMSQSWDNWDYYAFGPGENWKKLCAEYSVNIDSYEYEDGKDPGKPSATGLEQLQMNSAADCTEVSSRIHNCYMDATISFSAPSTVRGASAATVEMIRKR